MPLPDRYACLPPTTQSALETLCAVQGTDVPEVVRWMRAEKVLGLRRLVGEAEDGHLLIHWTVPGAGIVADRRTTNGPRTWQGSTRTSPR